MMKKLIAWVEIPAINFERAVNFYKEVFMLDIKSVDFGEEKMAFFPNNEGAISYSPGFKPSSMGALVSFNVPDNIDKTLSRATLLGGKVTIPKTKIEAENRGWFATFLDSEGNTIGLYGDQ